VGFGFHSIRGRMGQSPMGGGVDGLLERSNVNIYVLEIWRMVPIYLM